MVWRCLVVMPGSSLLSCPSLGAGCPAAPTAPCSAQEDDEGSQCSADFDLSLPDNGFMSKNDVIRSKVSRLTERLRKRYPSNNFGEAGGLHCGGRHSTAGGAVLLPVHSHAKQCAVLPAGAVLAPPAASPSPGGVCTPPGTSRGGGVFTAGYGGSQGAEPCLTLPCLFQGAARAAEPPSPC